MQLFATADAVIDFTRPEASVRFAALAAQGKAVHVVGTTGFSAEDLAALGRAARHTPIIQSYNMSLGVNLLAALVRQAAGRIIAGIGGILYYQNQTGEFDSWSYMWALIPGFVGVGTILAGLLGENTRRNLAHGMNLIVISAVLFLVFASFFGGLAILGDYGAAILLILLGLYVLVRGFVRTGYRGQDETR